MYEKNLIKMLLDANEPFLVHEQPPLFFAEYSPKKIVSVIYFADGNTPVLSRCYTPKDLLFSTKAELSVTEQTLWNKIKTDFSCVQSSDTERLYDNDNNPFRKPYYERKLKLFCDLKRRLEGEKVKIGYLPKEYAEKDLETIEYDIENVKSRLAR